MTAKNYIPEGYKRIKVVGDLCAFFTESFDPMANVVLYPRRLEGDFDAVALGMSAFFGLQGREIFIKYDEKEQIIEFRNALQNEEHKKCVDIILNDMEFLQSGGVRTHLRIVKDYKADKRTHEFHVDGLEQNLDRYAICYNEPVTQYIRNDDVIEVKGHDVVYNPKAPVYQFRPGDMWKMRVRNKPKNRIMAFFEEKFKIKEQRAFVHRAQKSSHPRLMVVGDLRV